MCNCDLEIFRDEGLQAWWNKIGRSVWLNGRSLKSQSILFTYGLVKISGRTISMSTATDLENNYVQINEVK